MAQIEPMDVDSIGSDFDDKENSLQNTNVFPRTPCTEKGYEELDVSELNMKLRYSITPTSSPMSKSYTTNYNKISNQDENLNATITLDNCNLTRSLNSTLTKCETISKSPKLPLQVLKNEFLDSYTSSSLRRSLDTDINNCTITISAPVNINDNLPSTSSSTVQTPEATTPTKDIPKDDGGSPIMRGLKSVLSMFRSSQSPIPSEEISNKDQNSMKPQSKDTQLPQTPLASTPIGSKQRENNTSKRSSPLKESLVFKDDLERELQWKDETTVIFKHEKIPINKLLYHQAKTEIEAETPLKTSEKLNSTVENMDMSYNETLIADKTMTEIESKNSHIVDGTGGIESDGEFLDCETSDIRNEELETLGLNKTVSINEGNHIRFSELETNNVDDVNYVAQDIELKTSTTVTTNIETELKDKIVGFKEMIADDLITKTNANFFNAVNTKKNERVFHLDNLELIQDDSASTDDSNLNTKSTTCILPDVNNFDVPDTFLHENEKEINNIKVTNDNLLKSVGTESPKHLNLEETIIVTCLTDHHDREIEISKLPNTDAFLLRTSDNINKENIKSNEDNLLENLATSKIDVVAEDVDSTIILPDMVNENINMTLDNMNITVDTGIIDHVNTLVEIKDLNISTYLANLENVESIEENAKNNDNNNQVSENNSKKSQNISLTNLVSVEAIENDLENLVNNNQLIDKNCKESPNTLLGIKTTDLQGNNSSTHNSYDKNVENYDDDSLQIHLTNSEINSVNINNINNSESINNNEQSKSKEICTIGNFETEYQDLPWNEENKEKPSEIPLPVDEDIEKDSLSSIQIKLDSSSSSVTEVCSAGSEMATDATNMDGKILMLPHHYKEINTQVKSQDLNDLNVDAAPVLSIDIQLNTNIKSDVASTDIQEEESTFDDVLSTSDSKVADNEIITSANNSPYISIDDLCISRDSVSPTKEFKNSVIATETVENSPPISPKLCCKGYSINFDDIDDPFATKTNIRMSPPLEDLSIISTLNLNQKKIDQKPLQMQNRRKSHPEKRNRKISKKQFNSSCDSVLQKHKEETHKIVENKVDLKVKPVVDTTEHNCNIDNNISKDEESEFITVLGKEPEVIKDLDVESSNLEAKSSLTELNKNEDDSNYNEKEVAEDADKKQVVEKSIVATHSVVEKIAARNVFNLPEIDDIKFNPFSIKSVVCQSPPTNEENTLDTVNFSKPQVMNLTSGIEHIQEDRVVSPDASNTTCSSKNADDKDTTVREVNTEDEDTIEGPFFDADVLDDIDKLSDGGLKKDMMQFEDFPIKTTNENKDDGELFIDAEAFEFLLNRNKCDVVADSGKESLFLKFDPLFAKRVSSDGVLAALTRLQRRQSTPKKPTKEAVKDDIEPTSIARTSAISTAVFEESHEETNATVSKPMMVVNPAVSSLISPRRSITPPKVNRRSLTFTSPAMAVIDRLLSLSGNTSALEQDTTMPQITREYNETDIALTQLRDLLAEKEIHVYSLRSESKELKERLSTMEFQVRTLEKESEERLKKINNLNERLAEKTKMNKSMADVVEQYERTIAGLLAEMDQEKRRNAEERTKLINERDEQTAHLTSMEVSFSDLHSKYEKSKQIILSMKANEDKYKKSISEFEESLLKMQKNYELLKQHATSKLNHANQELEKYNRAHEAEVLKLNAMMKRKELHITSLEESLSQKTKANEELTAICDELINKVG